MLTGNTIDTEISGAHADSDSSAAVDSKPIDHNLLCNIEYIQAILGNSSDLIIKQLHCLREWPAALIYIDGLVDTNLLHVSILHSLIQHPDKLDQRRDFSDQAERLNYLQSDILEAADVGVIVNMEQLLLDLLSGNIILLLEDCTQGLRIAAFGWEDRNVGEPQSQSVVRGPMEGFNENLRTNTALIRRRIKDASLWVENIQIGAISKTSVSVIYVKDVVKDEIIEEVMERLSRIDIDGILEGGYIEELIQDQTLTLFPTVFNSERPDTVAAALLEGRVAIIVDGSPFVLLVPALFVHFFQSPEDYYQRADISSLIRLIRYLAFFIAMLAPAFYIAISTFHQEMLPTNLLISLAAQREGVPFPAFIEALLMELTYEILREAGVRIPKTVGQAVSIVGTLVIGQAAVEAGVVSAAMVIIVSITAISSYVIPENGLSIAVRIIRFGLMAMAAAFGFFGVLLGLLIMVTHLTSLRSFGISYMSPFGPLVPKDLKDTLIRVPWSNMLTRPISNETSDKIRQQQPITKQKRLRRN
ncbi:spore germination protein [Paenibacillaceae bacterium]|nr:spore germination protein [Paenibacillaceae bacterium]